ncbi:MFS transporter [Streptomyces pseudogriseolus]
MTHALRLPGAVVAVAAAGQPPAPWPSGPASPRAAVAVALEDRGGIGVLLNFAFYGLIFVFSLFFQHVRDCSPLVAGLAFLPMTAAVMTANLACGPLVGRFGARTVLITGNTVAALGYLAIVPVVGSGAYAQMTVQFVVAGFGIGLVVPSMANTMLGPVDPANAGIASGVLNASRQLGGPIGGAVMGLLVGEAASGQFPSGLRAALLSAVAALAVSAALSVVGLRTPRASAEASPTATTPPPEGRRRAPTAGVGGLAPPSLPVRRQGSVKAGASAVWDASTAGLIRPHLRFPACVRSHRFFRSTLQELAMADLAFVITTIAVFALVALVAKGVTKL